MRFKTFIAITLLVLGLATAVQSQVVSQAYEVALNDFQAPATENGGASFRACEDCERQLVRVTTSTRYTINGKAVRFADFRRAVTDARSRRNADVTILHHLESDTIKSINVSL